MQAQEVGIKPTVKVIMKSDAEMLDEVMVVAYGTAKKSQFTGSASTIKADKIAERQVSNISNALSGQVAGVQTTSGNGQPGTGSTVRIRGVGSLSASNNPLYVVDGVPYDGDISAINSQDIESLTVLKDAASNALYGARGANGVILVTTKKGATGKATVNLDAKWGTNRRGVSNYDVMTSSQEYVENYYTAMLNGYAGGDPNRVLSNGMTGNQYINSLLFSKNGLGYPVYTVPNGEGYIGVDGKLNPNATLGRVYGDYYITPDNWEKELLDNGNLRQEYNVNISGSTEKMNYYMSAGYLDDSGLIPGSSFSRLSFRLKADYQVKEWLKVGLQSNLGYSQYETNNETESSSIYSSSPSVFARFALPYDSPRFYTFDDNGNIQWGDRATHLLYSGLTTPNFVNDNRDVQRRIVTANINLYQELTPIKGLTVRAQQSIDAYDMTLSNIGLPYEAFKTPMGTSVPARDGYRQESFSRYYAFTYTNTAEYKFNIDDHNVSVLAGQESIIAKSRSFGVFTEGHTDARQMKLTQAPTPVSPKDDLTHTQVETVFNSMFFTGSYNYASKYYLDLTFRRDGSSKFPKDGRWANFWSVGAMWDMKKESFMDNIDWLNELSVKVSYGTTGNSGISDYAYYGLIGSGSPYNSEGSLGISQASNTDLTWEKVAGVNAGLSFRIFDRLTANVDFYRKKTTDLLMDIPYSYTTGFSSGAGNIGAMVNKGVDLDFKVDIIQNSNFYWGFRANFNYNKNEITELFNGRDEYSLPDYGLQYKVGHSVGELYFVRRAGVDPRDGKQIWYDKDGNLTKVYNKERDAVLIGKDRYAPLNGGFGTEFSWKGISVSADFTWAGKKYLISNDRFFIENAAQGLSINQSTNMLNIWTKPGQITDIPASTEAIQMDDHLVENASFLRLKNVTVQYELPKSILKHSGVIERFNIFFTGRNLWTLTNFTGYDPEPDINLIKFGYPNTRQFVFGVELTF